MSQLLNRRVTIVWGILISLTLVTLVVGITQGADVGARIAALGLIVVAYVKARMVGLYFMELREAPTVLRALFEVWCAVICGVIAVIYMIA